jgi:hypothetical protein
MDWFQKAIEESKQKEARIKEALEMTLNHKRIMLQTKLTEMGIDEEVTSYPAMIRGIEFGLSDRNNLVLIAACHNCGQLMRSQDIRSLEQLGDLIRDYGWQYHQYDCSPLRKESKIEQAIDLLVEIIRERRLPCRV